MNEESKKELLEALKKLAEAIQSPNNKDYWIGSAIKSVTRALKEDQNTTN